MSIPTILASCAFAGTLLAATILTSYTLLHNKNEGFVSFLKNFFTNRFKSKKAEGLKKAVDHFLRMYGVDKEACICDIEEYLNSRK